MGFRDLLKYLRNYPNGFANNGIADMEGVYMNAIDIRNAEPGDMIKIVPVGTFPMHHNGGHEVTKEHVQEMAENFTNTGTDLLFDYEHSSLWGQSRAAGWSDALEAREDGLYCKYPEFTNAAQEQIDDREFRYFSPVYILESTSKEGKSLGAKIKSVAITNIPYFDTEIDPIGNSTAGGPKSTESQTTDTTDMKLNAESLQKLGLPEDATEEQVNQALATADITVSNSEAADGKSEMSDGKTPEGKTDTANEQPAAINKELEEKVNSLSKRIDDREKNDQEERVETLVNSAIAAGKINPADKDAFANAAKADFEGTKKMLSERKANSAMPGNVQVNGSADTAQNSKVNATEDCANYLRAQMKAG